MNRRAAAWEWTLHMELGQKEVRLTQRKVNPFGPPGVNYSESYKLTVRKLVYDSETGGGQ